MASEHSPDNPDLAPHPIREQSPLRHLEAPAFRDRAGGRKPGLLRAWLLMAVALLGPGQILVGYIVVSSGLTQLGLFLLVSGLGMMGLVILALILVGFLLVTPAFDTPLTSDRIRWWPSSFAIFDEIRGQAGCSPGCLTVAAGQSGCLTSRLLLCLASL